MDYIYSLVGFLFRLGKWASYALMITTLYLSNSVILNSLNNNIPERFLFLIPYASVAGALFITSLIDQGLYKSLVASFAALLSGDWKRGSLVVKAMLIMALLLAVLRFGLSTTSTLSSAIFMAEETKEEIDTKPVQKASTEKQQALRETRSEYLAQARQIRNDAQARANQVVEEAITSRGTKWAGYYREGNSWFLSGPNASIRSYLQGVQRAKQEAARITSTAQEEQQRIMASLDERLEAIEADESLSILGTAISAKIEQEETKGSIMKYSLFIFDIISSILTLFCAFISGSYLSDTHEPIEYFFPEEPSFGDAVWDGVLAVWHIIVSSFGYVAALLQLRGSSIMVSVADTSEEAYSQKSSAIHRFRQVRNGNPKRKALPSATRNATPKPQPAGSEASGEAKHESATAETQQQQGATAETDCNKTRNATRNATPEPQPAQPEAQQAEPATQPDQPATEEPATEQQSGGKDSDQRKALLQRLRRVKQQREKSMAKARAYRSKIKKNKGDRERNLENAISAANEAKTLKQQIENIELEITNLDKVRT